jgi:hypothetical protein
MSIKKQEIIQKEVIEKVNLSKVAVVEAVDKLLNTQKRKLDRQQVHLILVELKNTLDGLIDTTIYGLYGNDMHDYNMIVHDLNTKVLDGQPEESRRMYTSG